MKIKLLRKLRKQYSLQERNGKFRVFDNKECLGGVFNKTAWMSKEHALSIRRCWILEQALKYKKEKRCLT